MREARGTITPNQKSYVRALYREAYSNNYGERCFDVAHIDQWSQKDAHTYINLLLAAKARNWTKVVEDLTNTHVNVITPEGKPGTLLKRVWANSSASLLAKGYKLA